MQSKRERFFQAAEGLRALRCPVCGGALTRQGEGLACARGHTRDVNRKGYVHLLSRPHPPITTGAVSGPAPGVRVGLLPACGGGRGGTPAEGPQRILDAGCGEGYYLAQLLSRHPAWQGAGVDISKEAIEKATDWPCEAVWCVGGPGTPSLCGGSLYGCAGCADPGQLWGVPPGTGSRRTSGEGIPGAGIPAGDTPGAAYAAV